MMLVTTYLAQSGIHGIGLFAGQAIIQGSKIWQFMEGLDIVYDEAMLETAPEPIRSFLARYTYPHHSKKRKIILDGDHGRFMNHSDEPNTDFTQMHSKEGFALRNIAHGEELTCNYSEFAPGFMFS